MSSGYDFWRSETPVVSLDAFFARAAELQEATGLAPGWVSKHSNGKKMQKQANGDWIYVPASTPLGIQPFFKKTAQSVAAGGIGVGGKVSNVDELVSFLKDAGFDDPAKQKILLKNPKWVEGVLNKFGQKWFQKWLAHASKSDAPAATAPADEPVAEPAAAPAAAAGGGSPPPPPPETNPLDFALKKLGYDAQSPQAFVLAQFFKTPGINSDTVVGIYQAKYGITHGKAFHGVEDIIDSAKAKGVVTVKGDFDSGLVLTFVGGTGPVMSAPTVAVSAPVSTAPVAAPKAKAKKAPVAIVVPNLASYTFPPNPNVTNLANKLGFAPNSNQAKALAVWRKHFKKNHLTAIDAAATELASLSGEFDDAMKAFLNDLVLKKVYKLDDWDAAEFMVDPEPRVSKKKTTPAYTPSPAAMAAVTKAVAALPPEPVPASVPYAAPPPVPPAPPAPPESPSAGLPVPTDAKVVHWAGQLGYAPDTDEAKVLGLWQKHQKAKKQGTLGVFASPAAAVIGDLVAAGWGHGKAEVFAKTIIKKLLHADGFDLDDFEDSLPPEAPVTAPPVTAPVVPVTLPVAAVPGGPLPPIPAMSALSPAGDAKGKLGGNKPKEFLKDTNGNLFLYKTGADAVRAFGGQVAASVAGLVGGADTYVPVTAVGKGSDWGSVQPVVPDVVSDLSQLPLTNLSKKQLQQLQRERVIDWLTANHDSKAGNFVVRKNGDILGIDKEQAFKFIGDDELSLTYKPNPSPPVYNALYAGFANHKIDLDPNDMLSVIQAVESVSKADWTKAVLPYINAVPEDEREALLDKILARKANVRADFESFFTMLKKKRGEPGVFKFAGPAGEPLLAPLGKAVLSGTLIPPKLPSLATLTYQGKATGIGGAGEKHFFDDDSGKKFLLKLATNKSSGAPEPWKVGSQTLFATVGQAVKPATPPVGATSYNGKPATLQPWLGDNLQTLNATLPATLTTAEKKDVADEHVLDWLLSQHDTHGGNLIKLPNGSIVGIDKEQGFKYLLPNPAWTASTPEGDKLSTDYHPNAQYGEQAPYYNRFWGDFAAGKLSFDPTVMKDAIEAVEKIPDDQFVKALEQYASTAPGGASVASQIYDKALARKKNIRAEFEGFITGLYEKRTKKKGKFTYAGGWFPEGSVVATPAATAQVLPAAPPPPLVAPAPVALQPAAGHVVPKNHEVATASSKLGVPSGGVYYPALKALAQYGSPDIAIAALTATGLSADMAKKRVNYVHKKLKAAGGWAGVLAPTAPPEVPTTNVPAPGPLYAGKVVTFQHPQMSGPVGVVDPKLVTASDVLMNTSTKVKTPAGFPEPAPGKMWESKPFQQFFGPPDSGGFLYKAKSPKDKTGAKLDDSPYLLLKLSKLSVADAEAAFKNVGVTPLMSDSSNPIEGIHNDKLFFDSGVHLCAIVKKAEWEAVKAKNAPVVLQVDIPAPVMVTTGKFTTTPAAGELVSVAPPANGNLEELKTLQDSKEIGYSRGYMGDGKSVEHLSLGVQRNEDEKGTFYRVSFKLREPVWTKLKGYTDGEFQFNRTKYDPATDSWKKVSQGKHPTDRFDARQWESEGSTLSIGTGTVFSAKGLVMADVRLKAGETLDDGLRRVLSAAGPKLAEDVLKPSSKEDIDLACLSALLWSAAPQQADNLSDAERTIPELRQRLKALKYTDAELDSLRMETVANGYAAPTLPGRHKKMKDKFPISHVAVSGRGNVDAIVDQILGSTIGLMQRLMQGVDVYGNTTSAVSDLKTGGGDYVFGNVTYQNGSHTPSWGGGEVVMAYDLSELDRLDHFMHVGDCYGTCNPKDGSYGSAWKNRGSVETQIPHQREIMFRRGINSRKLLKVRIEDKTVAEQIIAKLKQRGVTTINGMKPEDLVVMKGSDQSFHTTYLKPAGY